MNELREEMMFTAQERTQDIVKLIRSNPSNPIAALVLIKNTLMEFYDIGVSDGSGSPRPEFTHKSISDAVKEMEAPAVPREKVIMKNVSDALVGILSVGPAKPHSLKWDPNSPEAREILDSGLYQDCSALLLMLQHDFKFVERDGFWHWSSPADAGRYYPFRQSKVEVIMTLIREGLVDTNYSPLSNSLTLSERGKKLIEKYGKE